jgi:WD40 repeat protein
LVSGGGTADHCIHFWNTLTGQSLQHIDTGYEVLNLAWSKDFSELISIFNIKVVLSFIVEMVFLANVRNLFYIQNSW